MIVLAIVLALSAVVGVAVFSRQDESKAKLAQTDLNTLKSAIRGFRLDFGRYPTTEEGVTVLWSDSNLEVDDPESSPWKKYLEDPMPNDRWGTAWQYELIEDEDGVAEYQLSSAGPDKEFETDDDIKSWTEDDGEGMMDDGAGLLPPGGP